MKHILLATVLALASLGALADASCTGHSCNDNSVTTTNAGGSGLGVASATSRNDNTNVNVNSASAKGGTALSGAYSGGNTQAVTVTDSGRMNYSGSYELKNVPNPPDVIANPTAPCRISVGVSGSGVGFGIGFGGSVMDDSCNSREDARLLYNLGLRDEAVLRLCAEEKMAAILKQCQSGAAPAQVSTAPTRPLPASEGHAWNGSTDLLLINR